MQPIDDCFRAMIRIIVIKTEQLDDDHPLAVGAHDMQAMIDGIDIPVIDRWKGEKILCAGIQIIRNSLSRHHSTIYRLN